MCAQDTLGRAAHHVRASADMATILRSVVQLGLLAHSCTAFTCPFTMRCANSMRRGGTAAVRPPFSQARSLRMQTDGGGGADTEEEEVPMQQYALNLEGHFKPQVGFMPHVFRVDGDFATGKHALPCQKQIKFVDD